MFNAAGFSWYWRFSCDRNNAALSVWPGAASLSSASSGLKPNGSAGDKPETLITFCELSWLIDRS